MKHLLRVAFVFCLFTTSAYAQRNIEPNKKLDSFSVEHSCPSLVDSPTVVVEEGKPVSLCFPDGRIATVQVSWDTTRDFETNFDVFESSCDPTTVGLKGTLTETIGLHRFLLVWVNNPDTSRIGYPVGDAEITPSSNDNGDSDDDDDDDDDPNDGFGYSLSQQIYVTQFIKSVLGSKFPQNAQFKLKFEKSAILGQAAGSTQIRILEMFQEQMIGNPETEVSENRISSGAFNLLMEIEPDGAYRLVNNGDWVTNVGPAIPSGFGDVITFRLEQPNGSCDVVIKPDYAKTFREASAYLESLGTHFTTYTLGESELSDYSIINDIISQIELVADEDSDEEVIP
ncbi:MAG: hypothetical protein KDD25_01550 [Bdellovibrionales bacterium]|nr:hypothetical protein [Bdellovibrionales bacterium]